MGHKQIKPEMPIRLPCGYIPTQCMSGAGLSCPWRFEITLQMRMWGSFRNEKDSER